MLEITKEDENKVKSFLNDRCEFFASWFNGTVEKDQLDQYTNKMRDDWLLVNKQTPSVVNQKEVFLHFWPTQHGRFKDNPIKQEVEIKTLRKLPGDIALVAFIENSIFSDKTSSRPISMLIDIDKEPMVFYVHES